MRYCTKCGKQLLVKSKYCPNCGATTSQGNTENSNSEKHAVNWSSTSDTTDYYNAVDIRQNKAMAILAYIGLLVLIPIFAAPKSRFARFHANQGLVLLIFNAAYQICRSILLGIWRGAFFWEEEWVGHMMPWNVGYHTVSVITGIAGMVFLALMIFGIVNAAKGKMKELPVIGRIRLLK